MDLIPLETGPEYSGRTSSRPRLLIYFFVLPANPGINYVLTHACS